MRLLDIDERQKAIVKQEPAPIEPNRRDCMRALLQPVPDDNKAQIAARNTGLLKREQLENGVVLAIALA